MLATLKLTKRPGWWKGKFALFWMLATGKYGWADEKGRKASPKANSTPTPTPNKSVGKDFYRLKEGATCRTNIALTHLVICHTLV